MSQSDEEYVDIELSTEISIDNDEPRILNVEWTAYDLEPTAGEGETPDNIPDDSPFVGVICRPATDDVIEGRRPDSGHYNGQVPIWISANIEREHIRDSLLCSRIRNQQQSRLLTRIVHHRGGYSGEGRSEVDAGHLLALSLGGDYIDWNLIPQNRALNQGTGGMRPYWYNLERVIQAYVSRTGCRVELQVRVYYDNQRLPDLPTRMKVSVRFIRGPNEENNEGNDEIRNTVRTLMNSGLIANQVESLEECNNFNNKIRCLTDAIAAGRTFTELLAVMRELNALWLRIINILEAQRAPPRPAEPQPSCSAPQRDRNLSLWDFVPVVGTIRTLKESAEDFEDGNKLAGSLKLGFGVLSAISDVTMVGGIASAAGKCMGREALKVGTKEAMKAGAKATAKAAGGEIVKSASISAAEVALYQSFKTGATQAAKAASKPVAKKVIQAAAVEVAEVAALNITARVINTAANKVIDEIE